MRIKVLFFASFREIVGTNSMELELADGATTANVFATICEKYPLLQQGSVAIAVNKSYITDTVKLKDGDEVALLPPISGG
jgi:molybdopterin converting factor subunit 1